MTETSRIRKSIFAGHTYGLPLSLIDDTNQIVVNPSITQQENLIGKSGPERTLSDEHYWSWWTDLMTTSRITGERANAVFSIAEIQKAQRAIFIGYGTGGDVLWMLNKESTIPAVVAGLEPNRRAFELSFRIFETLTSIVKDKSVTESFGTPCSMSSLLSSSPYIPGLAEIIRTAQMAIPGYKRAMAIKTSRMFGRVPLKIFLERTAAKLDSMTIEPVYSENLKDMVGMAIAYSTKFEPDITRYLYLFQTQYPNPALLNKFAATATGLVVSIALGFTDNWPDLYIDNVLPAVIEESKLTHPEYGYTHAATFHTEERLTTPKMRLRALMQNVGTGLANRLLGTGVNIQNVNEDWMRRIQDLGAEIHHRKGSSYISVYNV